MRYIVVECHLSYAVVLNEKGRFIKVANLHYEVGQTVTDVVEMKSEPKKATNRKWIYSIATAAACMLIVITAMFSMNSEPYGSVYMSVNPEVRIDVNRNNEVVDVEGLNDDGEDLTEEYQYENKQLLTVMDELLDRGIQMGYVSSGEEITLSLDAENEEWVISTKDELSTHVSGYLEDKVSVVVRVEDRNSASQGVSIPIETVQTQQSAETTYDAGSYERTASATTASRYQPDTDYNAPRTAATSRSTSAPSNSNSDYVPMITYQSSNYNSGNSNYDAGGSNYNSSSNYSDSSDSDSNYGG